MLEIIQVLMSFNFQETSGSSGEQKVPQGQHNKFSDKKFQKQRRHVVIVEDEVDVIPSDGKTIAAAGDEGDTNEIEIGYLEELKL